tara:strand:+ start:478 stop:1179 length:702 start_codon:yes stop_codon:yes gene_type:complete
MVKEIAIYLEGGGPNAETLTPFRQGMSTFLKPLVDAAREKRVRWKVIPCGGRAEALKAFKSALKTDPEVFNVLLVDAEEPVSDLTKPWDHLKARKGDEWVKPVKATNNHCHMMIVTMETWFLADAEALKNLFKNTNGFDASAFPKMPADPAPPKEGQQAPPPKASTFLESKSKTAVNAILKKAFKGTAAKEYRKIDDGTRMLAVIDPEKVRKYCPSANRLFKTLGKMLGDETL